MSCSSAARPDLVAGNTNASPDVFRKDLATGTIERLSQSGNGTLSNGVSFEHVISANGSFVIFASDATNLVAGDVNNQIDLFKKDLATGAIELVSRANDAAHSQGNGGSFGARISADGRYIVFESGSTNLVDNDTNDSFDIFRRNSPQATSCAYRLRAMGRKATAEARAPRSAPTAASSCSRAIPTSSSLATSTRCPTSS